MSQPRKAVYFFCRHLEKDPVADHVFHEVLQLTHPQDTALVVDGQPVQCTTDAEGNRFYFVQTEDVVSHNYTRYLPILTGEFADSDFAGLINWHEGHNAPDAILTIHSTGDVPSGAFGPAHPFYMRSLLLAMEQYRIVEGLAQWSILTEGTHWSGVVYGENPRELIRYAVPLVDIEIGSSPACWSDPRAVRVLARSLLRVFDMSAVRPRSLLCVGGVHLESSFVTAVLATRDAHPLAISHILPNQWVVAGAYDELDGLAKLEACITSISGGVDGIVMHDNLKGAYKSQLRLLADRLRVPLFKHQGLRHPESLPIWS